ncbi:MAG: hypothetical protein M3Y67_06070, partial [Pseudomonadota bacterium]|nr:hypothetical protein [Pseudomonadota bacterium]
SACVSYALLMARHWPRTQTAARGNAASDDSMHEKPDRTLRIAVDWRTSGQWTVRSGSVGAGATVKRKRAGTVAMPRGQGACTTIIDESHPAAPGAAVSAALSRDNERTEASWVETWVDIRSGDTERRPEFSS